MDDASPPTLRIPAPEEPLFGASAFDFEGPDGAPRRDRRMGWGLWVVAAALIAGGLFCFGQLALLTPVSIASADTRSGMKADYDLWPRQVVAPVAPEILEAIRRDNPALPTELIVTGGYWGDAPQVTLPSSTPTPTPTISPTPIGVVLVMATPTPRRNLSTPFYPPTATRRIIQPTPRPTRTNPPFVPRPNSTRTPTRTPTERPPTRTPRPPRYISPTPTLTPTHTPTRTPTRTPSNTARPPLYISPTPTRTPVRSNTPSPTRTQTPSLTPIPPSSTPVTPSSTPVTPSPTPITPSPTPVTPPPTPTSAINEGPPDGNLEEIPCGESRLIDLGTPRPIRSIVFYEWQNIEAGCGSGDGICLDHVEVFLSDTEGIPAVGKIFHWGDNNPLNNGYIFPVHFPETQPTREIDNQGIPREELYPSNAPPDGLRTGVCINVAGDNPPQTYRYLTFLVPEDPDSCDGDNSEIDAFEIDVNLSLCPIPPPTPASRR